MTRLEAAGHLDAAAELKDGMRCLNGLTDGWALFLESIEEVQAARSARFSADDQKALEAIRTVVHKTVYRR